MPALIQCRDLDQRGGRAHDPFRQVGAAIEDWAAKRPAHGAVVILCQTFPKLWRGALTVGKFVEDHGIDLVVIGRRGMGSMEGYLLGSVSQKVTYLSPVPVLIV